MLSALGHAISQLAISYADLGRHQEALVMQEETLEFQRRVLPENHPDIGATWLCSVLIEVQIDVLCSGLGQAMAGLANTYYYLGRHQDALVMQEETLEFQRRVLPENHPNIGTTWLCSILIEVQIDVLWSRLFNGQSRQHVLRSWAAPRCSCDEREDT
jgi:tetratricopeptide (TPR) repeat protein